MQFIYRIECIVPEKLEKTYKIQNLENPKFPDSHDEIVALVTSNEVRKAILAAQERYLPWQEFREKSWVPGNKEQVWALLRIQRGANNKTTLIRDKSGKHYNFNPNSHSQFLHEVDLELGGAMLGISDFSEGDKRQIIRRNLIEESIASSKLEGANTSRDAARRMLNEGHKPKDKDEQMIVNNHAVMKRIEEETKSELLSIVLLKDLHKQVTSGTLSDPAHEGEFRQTFDSKGQRLKIMPWDETTVAYVAPDREFVDEQLSLLIGFANDENSTDFVHPLFKAIMLHFWIGLLHPFEDGNGRLARILFYWYMLRKGYWAFSYLSLSEKILKSPKQYAMAYIYSEQDGCDLNYFIHYNINKLKLARDDLQKYLKQKIVENRQSLRLLQSGHNFNGRQLRLLQYLSKDEQRSTTVSSYHSINVDVGPVTVANDLKRLVQGEFLTKHKTGRNVFYYPTLKVRALFK